MRWLVPDRPEELTGTVREAHAAGTRLLFTGREEPPDDPGLPSEGPDLAVVSTARLRRVRRVDARELTATVEAGARLPHLADRLAREGAWLPLSGAAEASSPAREHGDGDPAVSAASGGGPIPLPGSVGGAVAAAPRLPFDESFGPIRRHLLSCRLVTHTGAEIRWGRGVMKDVAGYDLLRLACGSFGTIGVLLEATLRLWPAPRRDRALRIGGTPDPLSAAAEAARTEALAGVRPDAVVWRWTPGHDSPDGELSVRLVGNEASVAARGRRLREWCRERGLGARPGGTGWALSPRTPTTSVVGITLPRRGFAEGVRRVRDALAGRALGLEALPLGAHLRCAYDRERDEEEGDGVAAFRALEEAVGSAPMRVERGSAAEIEAARERTPRARRRLEERVLAALGGRPRHWLSGYL